MMSDLLVGSSIALLPFWCLDAKGGEVVLFRICFGLGVSRESYLLFVPVNFICVELWSNYYLIVIG
jgi:hypothetical protein